MCCFWKFPTVYLLLIFSLDVVKPYDISKVCSVKRHWRPGGKLWFAMPSCVSLFHLFIYFPHKLFFSLSQYKQVSGRIWCYANQLSRGQHDKPPEKKINTENNEQATRQQKDTFLHLRCQKYIWCLHKAACAKATILNLNAFIICFIHILNARPHVAQPRCYRRASARFNPAKWRDYANVNICLCYPAR